MITVKHFVQRDFCLSHVLFKSSNIILILRIEYIFISLTYFGRSEIVFASCKTNFFTIGPRMPLTIDICFLTIFVHFHFPFASCKINYFTIGPRIPLTIDICFLTILILFYFLLLVIEFLFEQEPPCNNHNKKKSQKS